jgi:hypothetical protein
MKLQYLVTFFIITAGICSCEQKPVTVVADMRPTTDTITVSYAERLDTNSMVGYTSIILNVGDSSKRYSINEYVELFKSIEKPIPVASSLSASIKIFADGEKILKREYFVHKNSYTDSLYVERHILDYTPV